MQHRCQESDVGQRVAMVTGGAGGLGTAYATSLYEAGANVILVDIDPTGLKRVAEGLGSQCRAFHCDLTDAHAVRTVFDAVQEQYGRLDILVNNAGGDIPLRESFESLSLDHWQTVLNQNLTSTFLCVQNASPLMKAQRYGKIVNVSSRSARQVPWYGTVTPAYVAAKAGVLALTRYWAKELGPFGINVNCLVPGFTISGPRLLEAWDHMTASERDDMIERTPLGRLPDPTELASVVLFLCSDASSYMTGMAVDVNGGSYMA